VNKDNYYIKTGVIPAAGSGSRLGYLSNLLPKTLFPVYDRPILHHIINLMESLGVEDIYIIVNIHKEKIEEYLKNAKNDLKARIHFVEQKELNGTANAIMLIKKFVKDEPFLTILGDECIINDSLKSFIEFFFKNDCIAAEIVVKEKDIDLLKQTCCAKLAKDNRIIEIIEKPKVPKYHIRGCGAYLFKPEIFEYIEKTHVNAVRKEKDITTAIDNVAKAKKAYGYFLKGLNININNADELLRASMLTKKYIISF
jgi:dTDP-glucose pyrophosphorylase